MEIHIGERVAEVQLVEKEGNQVRIAVDGQMYDVDIVIADNGVCSVIFNGQSYNMEIVRSDNGKRYKVNRGFNSYDVGIVDAQEKYLRSRRKDDGRQDDKITAAEVCTTIARQRGLSGSGDRVTDGDTLIVFEAMKMQSNLKVVGDCTVREVLVCEGDPVATGQPLIKLDILTNDQNNE